MTSKETETTLVADDTGETRHSDPNSERAQSPVALRESPDGPCQALWPERDPVARELDKEHVFAAVFERPARSQVIGRYMLIEHIGSGGMGDIFSAYDKQLDRKIAIKLVRKDRHAGANSDARLQREAQGLAQLSHPNVVQVYEAGSYQGRVYVAMEFIDGQTLRTWLHEHARVGDTVRWRAVLELFMDAGRGLAAAHEAGLVHRDFKPENVLVGRDGRPRVVDFGLARALAADNASPAQPTLSSPDDSGAEQSIARSLTRHGQILGTPRYMSPEQLRGEPTDERSDQFSFCVALFEALYGQPPFPGEPLQGLLTAIERDQPDVPQSSNVPTTVRHALLRGLAADPAERFPSMSALLTALEPAQQARHGARIVGSVLAAMAIAAIVVVTAVRNEPTDACAQLGSQLDEIWNAARKRQLATSFDTAQVADTAGTWPRMEAQLDAYVDTWRRDVIAACRANRASPDTPLHGRRMMCLDRARHDVTTLLQSLSDLPGDNARRAPTTLEALTPLGACRDDLRLGPDIALPGPEIAEQVARIRTELTRANVQETLDGHAKTALGMARRQLLAARQLGYRPLLAYALYTAGRITTKHSASMAQAEEGELLLKKAARKAERSGQDELVADIHHALMLSAKRMHDGTERGWLWSERASDKSVRLEHLPGLRAEGLRLQGLLAFKEHEFGKALALHQEALTYAQQDPELLPSRHSLHLQNLAAALRDSGRIEEAADAYRRAHEILATAVGPNHPDISDLRYDLATFLMKHGKLDRARTILEEVIAVQEEAFGAEHPDVGRSVLDLAELHRRAGRLNAAQQLATRGLEIYEKAFSGKHRKLARVHTGLGAIAYRRGDLESARTAYRRALAALQVPHRPDDLSIGEARANLAEVLVALGRPDEALEHIAAAEVAFAPHVRAMPVLAGFAASVRGRAQLLRASSEAGNAEQMPKAIAALERAVELLASEPSMAMECADARWALARALTGAQLPGQRARQLATEALAEYHLQSAETDAPRQAIAAWLQRR